MFTVLLEKIYNILNSNNLIQEVHTYEVGQFDGEPAAVIVPSGNDSDYATFAENSRIYAFNVRLYVARDSRSGESQKQADRVLRALVDSVLDDFDRDYLFDGLTVPTGYTMINVFALPSQWGYAGREDNYRVAEIVVRCRVRVDVTAIS